MEHERCIPLLYRQEVILRNRNVRQLNQVLAAFLDQYGRFSLLYPVDDVRPWTFQKIGQILAFYRLSLCYSTGILSRTDNMAKILKPERPVRLAPANAGLILQEYEQYLTFSFFHVVFSSFESSMRAIVGTVPVPNRKGRLCKETDKFSDIYHGLINFGGVDEKYRDLFELLLLMRNCIHNRSVFFSDKGSRKVSYNNKIYEFVQGQHIEFATIEFFFALLLDVKVFFEAVFDSPAMVAVPHIKDSNL